MWYTRTIEEYERLKEFHKPLVNNEHEFSILHCSCMQIHGPIVPPPKPLKRPRPWRIWQHISVWVRHDGHINAGGGPSTAIYRCNRCNRFLNYEQFYRHMAPVLGIGNRETGHFEEKRYSCYFCHKHGGED